MIGFEDSAFVEYFLTRSILSLKKYPETLFTEPASLNLLKKIGRGIGPAVLLKNTA